MIVRIPEHALNAGVDLGRRHSKGAAGLRMEQEKQAALAVENEEKRRVAEAAAVEAAAEAEKRAAVKAK